MKTKNLDIVYTVKDSPYNEELRYSLRSLKNLPHRKVWIVGGCPDWVENVERIVRKQEGGDKWWNAHENLKLVCGNENISNNFIFFNDDFYIMNPIEDLPYYYDNSLYDRADVIQNDRKDSPPSAYVECLLNSAKDLESKGLGIKNYELHVPMVLNKKKLAEILNNCPYPACRRSYYGNMFVKKSENRPDIKGYRLEDRIDGGDFYSTSDFAFNKGVCGIEIRKKFNEPCEYEKKTNNGYPDWWWWKKEIKNG